ncbi:hypothetical protein CTAYLR_007245 [Chrysophaeum taylorii]|uniref:Uncharacterized protein n=1 Tax=Chrysophaeum taylorii TaxID=2483200 RepID=A0AAD7XKC3_9STRA|nr:hypothetical protein CTAYLR_007245 [Chrysophaeum taylorii]
MNRYVKLEPSLASLLVTSYEGGRDAEGRFEGEGSALFTGGQKYSGNLKDGMMHGAGTYEWPDGTVYRGEFARNVIMGSGSYEWPDGSTYTGEVRDGLRHGRGAFAGALGRYDGEWQRGQRHGAGTMTYSASCVYTGEWVQNKRHGQGEMVYESGNSYAGSWANDAKNGRGTMTWKDRGESYDGEWRDDKQNGFGTHVWAKDDPSSWVGTQRQMHNSYRGEWRDGLRHGDGTFFYANGARYAGTWVSGIKEGNGVFIHETGALYVGAFVKDRMADPSDVDKPQLFLCVDDLLPQENEEATAAERTALDKAILRVNSELKAIYQAYAGTVDDGIFAVSSRALWQLCRDVRVVPGQLSVAAVNAVLLAMRRQHHVAIEAARNNPNNNNHNGNNNNNNNGDEQQQQEEARAYSLADDERDILTAKVLGPHSPVRPILYREFVEAVVRIAVVTCPSKPVSAAFKDFMICTVIPRARQRGGPASTSLEEEEEEEKVASDVVEPDFSNTWSTAVDRRSVAAREFADAVAREAVVLTCSSFGTLTLAPALALATRLFPGCEAIRSHLALAFSALRRGRDPTLVFLATMELEMTELAEFLARVACLVAGKSTSDDDDISLFDDLLADLTPRLPACAIAAAQDLDTWAKASHRLTPCVEPVQSTPPPLSTIPPS